MEEFKFIVTIKIEHPENFTCDEADIKDIVNDGIIDLCNNQLGNVEVTAKEEQ